MAYKANKPYILQKPKYGVHPVLDRETGQHIGTIECLGRNKYKATRLDGTEKVESTRRWAGYWLLAGLEPK